MISCQIFIKGEIQKTPHEREIYQKQKTHKFLKRNVWIAVPPGMTPVPPAIPAAVLATRLP